jgi:predicted adenine nucleotide alpha hydrolase (AANH) superfamily ATPase
MEPIKNKLILVHICCAPCALFVVRFLKKEGAKIIGFFYNPNIHGAKEYKKRLKDVKKLFEEEKLKLEIPQYDIEEYFGEIYDFEKKHYKKIENSKKLRCPVCYRLRLEKTALYAKNLGADFFSTTLLISPYQDQSTIWQIGTEEGEKSGVPFFFRDFRKGYWESIHRAKKRGFYIPSYCGCVYSLKEIK